ncbi:MAG: hypothetical protein ABFD97_20390 [Syntrophobacter sp.]
MSDLDSRIAVLELCDEAERFFATPIGRYIVGVSDQEVQAALDELKKVDPEDTKKIRELQNRIAVAEGAIVWMAETMANGRQVLQLIAEEDQEYGNES